MGREISSSARSSAKFASAFPKTSAAPEIGDAISVSRQSLGWSRAKLRLMTSAPANAKTSHSKPPASSSICSEVGSNANEKRSKITIEKESEALMVSLLRISERRSFAVIVRLCRRKLNSQSNPRAMRPVARVPSVIQPFQIIETLPQRCERVSGSLILLDKVVLYTGLRRRFQHCRNIDDSVPHLAEARFRNAFLVLLRDVF